jgi:uncharacterized protein YyaL (SSP411 family)
LADRRALDGKPTAYLCEGFVCQAPTQHPSELARQLDARLIIRRDPNSGSSPP